MALFRKFFYRKPPDGLLEISERVYVFDYCFTTDVLEEDEYKVYIGGIVAHLREHFPDASFMVFNFREGEQQSQIASILSEFDTTVMDYPRHYEGCPLLTMEMVHHFLRSSESWLSLGQNNVLLMHCERGGWPVLAFMLAGLMIYRKQYTGEQKTLDMIYKQAPRELLQLLSPLNPLPSQLRYLQYISRRNVGSEWPPLDRALTLDCVILRVLPNFDRESGCRPIFRIYGQDPFIAADRTPKVLFSTPKKSKAVRLYKADCELVKIDIHCHIQGDVVLECISLDEDVEREEMMFRVMFNTAFIRSNILILNRDEIDILWDAKDRFPKDFRAEILLSEMDAASSIITMELTSGEEKEGLPVEAFAKVQEIFSNVDWLDPSGDAALHVLHHIASSNALQLDGLSPIELECDAMSQISSPGVLKEILQSQEANDGREDVAFRVLQHIASSKALQEKLDALSPKEFESDDMSQKSSPSMLKEMLRSQEANDGRGDVALRVLQHIASSKTLQEKLDAWSLKEVETDALSQKSQETNAQREDAAFPGLKNMASLNALQEKHDPSSQKEVESDYISEKSSPSVLKEMTQSRATDDGRTVAAHDVLQHFETPNALQEKIDASSLKEMESDALSRKPNPLPNEILQSHESITSIEKSSPAANPSDWKAASENIELRDAAAAGHPSQPEFLIQHTESGSDPASSNNPLQSLESNDGIKNSSPTAPKQQSIPFNERSPDSNAKSQNIKLHNVGAALHPSQPRILAQRMPKSRSNPTSLNNSLQGPPVPISRYHSAPSALGITALLHDHAAFGSSEVTHSVAIPPLSLSLSSASVYGLCEPTRIKTASPTPVLSSSTISTEISMIPSLSTAVTDNSATTATISSPPPPPLPPVSSSASPRMTFSIPPPPPPPFLCSPSTITTTAAATMRMVTPSPSSPRPLLLTPSPPPPPPPPPKSEPTVMLPSLAHKAAPQTSSTSASLLAWAPEQLSKPLKNLPASEPVNTTPSPRSPHYGTSSVKGLPNSVPCSPPPPSSLGTTFSVSSPRCESNIPSTSPGPTREQLSKPLKNLPASEPVNTAPSPRSLHYGTSSVKGLPNSVPCPPPPPSSLGTTFSVVSPRCESNTPSMPPGPPREQLSKPLKNLPASEPVNKTPSPRSPHYGTSSVKGLPNSVPCPPPPPSSLGTTFSVGSPRYESNTPSMPPGPPPPPPPPPPPRVDPLTSYHPPSPASVAPPPPPPPPRVAPSSPNPPSSPMKIAVAAVCAPPPPPPPPRVDPLTSYHPPSPASVAPPPPPPPPRVAPSSPNPPSSPMKIAGAAVSAPPPPPPPSHPTMTSSPSAPPPPPLPNITSSTNTTSQKPSNAPPIPPPPGSLGHGALNGLNGASSQSTSSASKAPPPPTNGMLGSSLGMKGRSSIRPNSRNTTTKRSNLKPLHWVKVTRAMSGSLWAEAQKPDEASRAPEFDMSELESLFSTAMPNSDARGSTNRSSGRSSLGQKSEKVQLIDLRRANNCEIMLTKVKMPLPDLMSSLLALDDSVLDIDQIDNLIKFCPTKEEMDLLKAFSGDKESLGKCEQYFLELMKVPRVESKLRVFSFKIQFRSQVVDLSKNLNTVNSAAGEIRNSAKLKRIMQTILSLGNALNQGTARGSAVGFRLDSLLKLTDTRARNNKMTLMHYLCKVLAEKLPELLDFSKDLVSLEVASKIQLKTLAEEMQSISKGLEKVEQELTASENDGPVSETFHKTLKEFLVGAEAEVRALTSLYSNVGRNADALALYFGEDPARCPFEQVVSTLLNFVKMFARSHEENCKQLELEKKKAQKEADSEKAKLGTPKREFENLSRSSSNKNESLSRSSSNKNANIK